MSRPRRNPERFPSMKRRGVCRRYRLRRELDVATVTALYRMGITPEAIEAAVGGMTKAILEMAAALRAAEVRWIEGLVAGLVAYGVMDPEPLEEFLREKYGLPAKPAAPVDRSGYVLADAFEPEPEPCSLCDDHVHDITNTACVCCMVNAPDPAGTRRAPADLLTLQCMAAEHDHCEGDFCECACHDTTDGA